MCRTMTSFSSFLACLAASAGESSNMTDVPYSPHVGSTFLGGFLAAADPAKAAAAARAIALHHSLMTSLLRTDQGDTTITWQPPASIRPLGRSYSLDTDVFERKETRAPTVGWCRGVASRGRDNDNRQWREEPPAPASGFLFPRHRGACIIPHITSGQGSKP